MSAPSLGPEPFSARDLRAPVDPGEHVADAGLRPAVGDLGMWLRRGHVRYDVAAAGLVA
ncbi:hypothetical protein [Nocardia veterana]|uniref:Uncharacterized protein n=1 Tax=Nocardia veterana TaxID=132249 RepID=A0A7X6RIT2_9NOCA|nr:hypothetical protein [Nocardia veterana]NKY87517.1 hypothetical protein [Nocardia veterana]